jgi:hypothetical protein
MANRILRLDEIGLAVYEEISFKVQVYGPMPDEKQSQKLTMTLFDRGTKNKTIKGSLFRLKSLKQ